MISSKEVPFMKWEANLSGLLNKSGIADIEIHAWTNIHVTVLSNIRNGKHKNPPSWCRACRPCHIIKLLYCQ